MTTQDFSVLVLQGSEPWTFLNNYTTCSWKDLELRYRVGAIVTAQGRVLSTFVALVSKQEQSVELLLPTCLIDQVKEFLQNYARFAKINFQLRSSFDDFIFNYAIEKRFELPFPWLKATSSSKYICHDLSLDLLGFIAFDKGCYLGQEIVARVHYKLPQKKYRLAKCVRNQDEAGMEDVIDSNHDQQLIVVKTQNLGSLNLVQVWDESQSQLLNSVLNSIFLAAKDTYTKV